MTHKLALAILLLSLAAGAWAETNATAPASHSAAQAGGQPATRGDKNSTPQAVPAETVASKSGTEAKKTQAGEHAAAATGGDDREKVLAKMNQSAAGFKSAQGNFEFETYQKVVQEKDSQTGHIYFRRVKDRVDAAFEIEGPAPNQVVYKDGKLRIFEKKINQVTERDVSKNKQDVEAFLSLGFGASGTDLVRDYDVKMLGWETVDGVRVARLDLTPKSDRVRQTYNKIELWIDPERDISVRQQFFEPSGDYRLAHYTEMKLGGKISDEVFRLKTNEKTKTVTPQ
jgi:outer membrane lipoprotein-sorting protein